MGQIVIKVPQDVNLVYYIDDWDVIGKILKFLNENAIRIENLETSESINDILKEKPTT